MSTTVSSATPDRTSSDAGRDVACLLLRLAIGAVFIGYGLTKVADIAAVQDYFASLSIPQPGFWAPAITFLELIGGVLLIAGVLTRLLAAVFAVEMAVALVWAKMLQPDYTFTRGYDLDLVMLAGCLALVALGSGRFSVMGWLGRPRW